MKRIWNKIKLVKDALGLSQHTESSKKVSTLKAVVIVGKWLNDYESLQELRHITAKKDLLRRFIKASKA